MPPPLSIGLNLTYLTGDSGGSGTYAAGLIGGLRKVAPADRLVAFVADEIPSSLRQADWFEEVQWVRLPVMRDSHPHAARALWMARQWLDMPLRARSLKLDVIHGLANIVPPAAPGVATVVTLLDVIWMHYPSTMERSATIAMRLAATASVRTADRIITISEAAKQDIAEALRVSPDRIDVTHLATQPPEFNAGTSPEMLRQRLQLADGPVVLCVAQKREHKNLLNLIRAVPQLPRDVRLVLPGSATPYERELRAVTEALGLSDRVVFLPWLSDPDLEGLYALATCCVLPSLIEGFGLPLLEAMARGVPVACSDIPSLTEVAGTAALHFDPLNPNAISGVLSRILDDGALRDRLVEAGHRRVREFSWDATAEQTLASYRRAIDRGWARTGHEGR